MSIVWPHVLPDPLPYDGTSKTLGDNLSRFQPDVGREVRRRRTSARDDVYSLTFAMSHSQVLVFQEFFSDTIADGALSFQMMLPMPRGPSLVSIRSQPSIERRSAKRYFVSFDVTRYG